MALWVEQRQNVIDGNALAGAKARFRRELQGLHFGFDCDVCNRLSPCVSASLINELYRVLSR